ncbi:MAG: hypothetical protein LBN95_02775 [Prevotellaceae bacterium]|jgi:hypothetical protein|nr:hypothetical protein [Prevotellaceae bacterium]
MIKIILRDIGESLDLPPDIKISIERNNVMFKENADYTLPITLPLTEKNNRNLNFPLEIAAVDFGVRSYPVLVQFHGFQFVGNLKILSASKKGVNITIVMGNSELYNQIGGKNLADCFKDIVWDTFANFQNPILKWVQTLEAIMIGNNAYDLPFSVFPVVTKVNSQDEVQHRFEYIPYANLEEGGNNFLNYQSDFKVNIGDVSDNNYYYALLGRWAQTAIVNDVEVTFPIGYNVTPFLKLWWVLDNLFSFFGFEFTSNFFKTGNFEKMCVLNNTRDSLLAGKIFASHLIPDCTVSQFLDCLRFRYGCEFVLEEGTNKVNLKFYKNILKSESKNYTPKIGSNLNITYQEKQTLSLSSKKSVFGDGVKYKTFQELNHYLPNIQYCAWGTDSVPGNYFDTSFEKYYKRLDQANSSWFSTAWVDYGFDCLDFYDEDSKLPAKELKSNYTEYSELVAKQSKPVGPNNIYLDVIMHFPFISGKRNKTSNIVINGENTVIDNSDSCPIQFCYELGQNILSGSYTRGNYVGSAHIYRYGTNLSGVPNMFYAREDGLFQWFFKEYDAALRNGMHKINFKPNITDAEIVDFDFYNLLNVQGQNYIPTCLKYEITQKKINIVDCELLLVKL